MAREMLSKILKKEELPKRSLLAKYKPAESWFIEEKIAYGIHGIEHETRVLIWQEILSIYLAKQGNKVNQEALRWAAVTHDTQRKDHFFDVDHGKRSAEWVKNNIFLDAQTLEAVAYLNYNHVPEDYLIPKMPLELLILKDADALDRARLDDLNPLKLRNPITKKLIRPAEELCDKTMKFHTFDEIIEQAVKMNLVLNQ
jgi:uncharacterized protein